MKAGAPRTPCRNGDEVQRAASLSVKVTDRILRARQPNIVSPAGARHMNAAVPIRPNLLRLEHRLQTVVDGGARAAAITLKRRRHRRHGCAHRRRHAPHGTLRLPYSFKGISGSLRRPHRVRLNGAGADRKPRSLCDPAIGFGNHRGGRAGCPDGTQPEHFTVSHSFIRPRVRNWQAAYWICSKDCHQAGGASLVRAP